MKLPSVFKVFSLMNGHSKAGHPRGAVEGSQGQTAKPWRPWTSLSKAGCALLRARRNLFHRTATGRAHFFQTSPGAACFALAPGCCLPGLWRSGVSQIVTFGFCCGALVLLCCPTAAIAKEAQPAEDPQIEQRMRALTQQLRCLVCQNETLADSQADLAEDLRREIRSQMKAGKSDQEILAYLTERYGDFVLYKPPVKSTTYLLWFGPFVLLVVGVFALYRYLKQRKELIHEKPLTPDERRRAEELLRSET